MLTPFGANALRVAEFPTTSAEALHEDLRCVAGEAMDAFASIQRTRVEQLTVKVSKRL